MTAKNKSLSFFDILLKLFKYNSLAKVARAVARAIIYYDLAHEKKSMYFGDLVRRMNVTAIGMSGHVSLLDKSMAKGLSLKPLSVLELWYLWPIILDGKKLRWNAWRETNLNHLCEDLGPFEIGSIYGEDDAFWEPRWLEMMEHWEEKPVGTDVTIA